MFPLKKQNITINSSETQCLSSYKESTEIPILPHPGAFSKVRKNHIHEGIDLYCEQGDKVFAIEAGTILAIQLFTGKEIDSPWWNTTWCVLVKGKSGVINYGEIIPNPLLSVGDEIAEGTIIGNVETVLTVSKGRPMTMLHLELYTEDTTQPIKEWSLNTKQPSQLLDPTSLLLNMHKE